jgi:ribosomal protein S18 acetylase RimI-like enzyme
MPLPLKAAAALGVSLRPMTDDDLGFAQALYASTRADELAPVPWPEETKQAFLAQQFSAQHEFWTASFEGLERWIVEREGQAIGRIYLRDNAPDDLRVVDIALVPERRAQGLGAALMRDAMALAARRGMKLSIHVEKNNPARALYARLGFEVIDADRGVYDLLEWNPRVS